MKLATIQRVLHNLKQTDVSLAEEFLVQMNAKLSVEKLASQLYSTWNSSDDAIPFEELDGEMMAKFFMMAQDAIERIVPIVSILRRPDHSDIGVEMIVEKDFSIHFPPG